jgi:hypothetical protein
MIDSCVLPFGNYFAGGHLCPESMDMDSESLDLLDP